jgi:hypothetical protein
MGRLPSVSEIVLAALHANGIYSKQSDQTREAAAGPQQRCAQIPELHRGKELHDEL